jgi:uncharacterized protein (DUF4415 family)
MIVRYTVEELRQMPRKLTPAQEERLARMTDDDIDYSDIPDMGDDEEFFANAIRGGYQWPQPKRQLTIRIDADILDWLKSKGRGHHPRLNYILRMAMVKDQHREYKARQREAAKAAAAKAATAQPDAVKPEPEAAAPRSTKQRKTRRTKAA